MIIDWQVGGAGLQSHFGASTKSSLHLFPFPFPSSPPSLLLAAASGSPGPLIGRRCWASLSRRRRSTNLLFAHLLLRVGDAGLQSHVAACTTTVWLGGRSGWSSTPGLFVPLVAAGMSQNKIVCLSDLPGLQMLPPSRGAEAHRHFFGTEAFLHSFPCLILFLVHSHLGVTWDSGGAHAVADIRRPCLLSRLAPASAG